MTDNTVIDLIYVEYTDAREMSCAVVYGGDGARDKLLGPVDSKGAVTALATLLQAELSDRFSTVKDAETFLTMTHFRNITRHENSAGQAYPFKIQSPKAG